MKAYADYYSQLDAKHQRELDNQATYGCALDSEKFNVDDDLKARGEKSDYFSEITEILSINDNFWLAIGSGASYDDFRSAAIEEIAARNLEARKNDYYPD